MCRPDQVAAAPQIPVERANYCLEELERGKYLLCGRDGPVWRTRMPGMLIAVNLRPGFAADTTVTMGSEPIGENQVDKAST